MRIIGGKLKRRLLFFPKTKATRPVTDRAKETIFGILGERVSSRTVLDLFAGSGSFGLEALSRGAKEACFVDWSGESRSCVFKNLNSLGLKDSGYFLKMPISQALKRLENQGKTFDLIFLDPPHNKGLIKKILHLLDGSAIVGSFAIIVAGHSNLERLPDALKTLWVARSAKIGQTFASFLEKGILNDPNKRP